MDGERTMVIGNDELILHLRKNYPENPLENGDLGKRLWAFIRDELRGELVVERRPALWEVDSDTVGPTRLPRSAAQFRLPLEALPRLFTFVGELGGCKAKPGP